MVNAANPTDGYAEFLRNQRTREYLRQVSETEKSAEDKPGRIQYRTLVVIERDESLGRVYYEGLSRDEIIEKLKKTPIDDAIQEFVDDVQGTSAEKLCFIHQVKFSGEDRWIGLW